MSKPTRIRRETLLNAGEAARQLKEQLLLRVLGHQCEAMSCGCGAIHSDRAVAVDITYPGPESRYAEMMGEWMHWSVCMKEIGKSPTLGYSYSFGISNLIPWSELYPLFRNVFEPIGVPVDHPHASGYNDKPHPFFGDGAATDGRNFTASGLAVIVTEDSPVYVQPIGDLTHSVWLNAELRVDSKLKRHQDKGLLLACNVDPFGMYYGGASHNGRDYGEHCGGREDGVENKLTFYIRIPGDGHGKYVYIPSARLVAYDPVTGAHILELDHSVELFKPNPQ